ncbi:hypothetical protein P692DRAFT_20880056 [Suillus brevipes Sb2]|jgi:outer membrane murein-binding lipoprotein Lpp|nr:hypothetical protein P692DRAFT_20880056 [Suillus brevipes Sb2]
MATNNVSLISEPSNNEALPAMLVTGKQSATAAQLNARVAQLEEERPRINKMLQDMERLVKESLSRQRGLENYVQKKHEFFQRQGLQYNQDLNIHILAWRSIMETIYARVEALEMDQMASDESYRLLSNNVAMLEDGA